MAEVEIGKDRYLIGVKVGDNTPGGDDPQKHFEFLLGNIGTLSLSVGYPEGIVDAHRLLTFDKEDSVRRLSSAQEEMRWLHTGHSPRQRATGAVFISPVKVNRGGQRNG